MCCFSSSLPEELRPQWNRFQIKRSLQGAIADFTKMSSIDVSTMQHKIKTTGVRETWNDKGKSTQIVAWEIDFLGRTSSRLGFCHIHKMVQLRKPAFAPPLHWKNTQPIRKQGSCLDLMMAFLIEWNVGRMWNHSQLKGAGYQEITWMMFRSFFFFEFVALDVA